MTPAQRKRAERLFLAIGKLEGKAMGLKTEMHLTAQHTERDVFARVETHLKNAWAELTDAGLIR